MPDVYADSGDSVTGFLKDLVSDASDLVKAKYQRDLTVGSNAGPMRDSVGTPPNAPIQPTNAPPGAGVLPQWALILLAVSVVTLVGAVALKALR